ncbi:NAD(+) synthase [bacterium]|jgi:NAD+ synthase|nr:NAD(+) synthase [bacterium]
MELKEYLDYLVDFLKDYLKKANADGYVLGVSGGVDSAVCAQLIKRACGDNCLGLILPCYSEPTDTEDAILACKAANLEFKTISLNDNFDIFKKLLISSFKVENNSNSLMTFANLKARLRMLTLYATAQLKRYLVIGTDNLAEYYVGYFTKHGDGACDILPLVRLTKTEVTEAARILGVPEKIINKRPTAGLIESSYDELELGFSYKDLDAFLRKQEIDPRIRAKIEQMHKNSAHKRALAPRPKPFRP